jgi:hypothetical protein
VGQSFWVFSGPTPDDMLVYPERQKYGIRGVNSTSPEGRTVGYTSSQNPNVTLYGKPLSRFTEPVFIPDDSRFALFRVHKQVLKDFEQVGLAPLYLKRDFVSSTTGADVFHYNQEVVVNGLPQYSTQTTHLRQEEPDWLLYLEPVVKDERKRLELRSAMEGITNAIHEVIQHPGAHNEHLLAFANMSFLAAPTPFKMDKSCLDNYEKAIELLYEQVWEITEQWYPWFVHCNGSKQPSPKLRNAETLFLSQPPIRMRKLAFGQDDYIHAIFAADMTMEYRYGSI